VDEHEHDYSTSAFRSDRQRDELSPLELSASDRRQGERPAGRLAPLAIPLKHCHLQMVTVDL